MLLLRSHSDRVSLVMTVFFSLAYSFCRDNLMCGSLNSYVATLKNFLRQSFYAASSNLCRDPVFMSQQHFCFCSCCNTFSCIVKISVVTQKVCHERVFLPLNLISCCSFILMFRHGLLVLLMFAVATKLLFLVLESLSRHRKVGRDLVYLCLTNLCVATLGSLSRNQNISSA